jgi:GAF domain-containing protein
MPTREALLAQTFVQLADTLIDEFDIIELLTALTDRCLDLLDVGAAGILLADHKGVLHVVAASSEQVRLLELFQLQNMEGPCLDCYTTGQPVVNENLAESDRWPRFGPEALSLGYQSVQALPLRLRDHTIGALNVFVDDRVIVTDTDLLIAQALADAATIAILQDQATRESQLLVAQLNYALNSRITIEQAKGVLAERAGVDMDAAFARLRTYARSHNLRLGILANDLVSGTLAPEVIAALVVPPT